MSSRPGRSGPGGPASGQSRGPRRWLLAEARGLAGPMRARMRGRDIALAAAGLTFYSGIAVVPCLLLAVWLTGLVASPATVTDLGGRLVDVLPPDLGAAAAAQRLLDAGLRLSLLGAVVAIFPASFYGEGLRRAFRRFAPGDESFVGWRGRLLVLPLFVAAPVLLQPLLVVAGVLQDFARRQGTLASMAGVLLGFTAVWLALAVVLAWSFRVIGPVDLDWVSLLVGALATAACLSGFLQGFVLFLALPLDLGAPFGGLTEVGAVIAVGFWLFVLHLVVLLGWVFTLALAERLRARGAGATEPPA